MQIAQKCLPRLKLIKKYIDHFFLFLYKETQLRQRGRKGIPLAASFFYLIGDGVGLLYMRSTVSDFVAYFFKKGDLYE